MKEKIKKILNKKVIICIVLPLLILGVSFGGFYFYKNQQELNKNEDFVFDVVLALKNIYDSRGVENKTEKEIKDEELKFLQEAYQMKTEITDAKSMIEKWENNNNEKRKKIAEKILEGLVDLDEASDAFIRVAKDFKKEDAALFNVKLESGRGKVFIGASMIVFPDDKIRLSQNSKGKIIRKIDSVFDKPIENYKSNKTNEDFSQPQEVWAVILIRNIYANDLGLSKI